MRTMQRLLICLMCFAPTLAAQSWRVDTTRLNAWAQDSTGQVWGIGALMGFDLYRWQGNGWDAVAVDQMARNYRPAALTSGPDGTVYCLWSNGESEHTLTWHKG